MSKQQPENKQFIQLHLRRIIQYTGGCPPKKVILRISRKGWFIFSKTIFELNTTAYINVIFKKKLAF
jgi:hypothetical protein